MNIDLTDLQWWQTLVAIIGVLGLSPAPWILGLATGRIQFSRPAQADYDKRIADLVTSHTAAVAALTGYHADQLAQRDDRIAELKGSLAKTEEARTLERDRADKATATLAQAIDVVEVSNHLLESLGQAAEDGSK